MFKAMQEQKDKMKQSQLIKIADELAKEWNGRKERLKCTWKQYQNCQDYKSSKYKFCRSCKYRK